MNKIILILVIITLLISLSGCQSVAPVVKGVGDAARSVINELKSLPDHLMEILAKIMSSLSDIGRGIADMFKNMVPDMRGP